MYRAQLPTKVIIHFLLFREHREFWETPVVTPLFRFPEGYKAEGPQHRAPSKDIWEQLVLDWKMVLNDAFLGQVSLLNSARILALVRQCLPGLFIGSMSTLQVISILLTLHTATRTTFPTVPLRPTSMHHTSLYPNRRLRAAHYMLRHRKYHTRPQCSLEECGKGSHDNHSSTPWIAGEMDPIPP